MQKRTKRVRAEGAVIDDVVVQKEEKAEESDVVVCGKLKSEQKSR
jgi:hypothetical protein